MGFLRKLLGGKANAGAAQQTPARADGAAALARALELVAQGRPLEALPDFDRAAAELPDPARAEALSKRGGTLMALGRVEDALASFEQAIRSHPAHADANFNRGVALQGLQRFEDAAAAYARAIEINAADAQAWNNRGVVLGELRRLDEALRCVDRAIALQPDYADAHNNRAVVQGELRDFAGALHSLDRAIALKPDYVDAWFNHGNMEAEMQDWPAAIASYDRAIGFDPAYAPAHWNQSLCHLRSGDFERGWRKYEWRWDAVTGMRRAAHAQPLWLGETPLAGRTILLHAEQGLGDTLQFCRFAAQVRARGARVLLEVQPPLLNLLSGLKGIDGVFAQGDALPDFDYHCPLMSLPLALNTGVADIPAPEGYLAADPAKVAHWRARLGDEPALRVGVVWAGGFRPHQPVTWSLNERRNMDPRHLAMLDLPGVRLFSLQKGPEAVAQLAALRSSGWHGPAIADYTEELADFADTAALVANLDLVVAVDTSVAHLAGALGKPVWLLNRFDTCWRWMQDRPDTPWYASMRIFRQPGPGDWQGVMREVRGALAKRVPNASVS